MKQFSKIRMGSWSLALGLLAATAVVFACSVSEPPLHAEKAVEEGGSKVLARVGDVEITEADAAMALLENLGPQERHDALERGVETLASKRLLELAAAAEGMSAEDYEAREMGARVEPPTDAEVDAFYEARKSQIQQPKEQVVPRIRDFLTQQKSATAGGALIAELKKAHGFEMFLETPRIEVESEGHPARGPADAPVTIVEFSDFECPFCSRVVPTMDQIKENYGDKVRLVFRQFPLGMHANARKAAEASLCAREQDKFWEMHDLLFAEQKQLSVAQLKEKASRLGLEAAAFDECLDSGRHAAQVQADFEAGSAAGVTGTPASFVNGRFLSGAQPYEAFAKVIDEELERAGS